MSELKLAIRDDEYGPRINETRVLPPEERDRERRLKRVQEKIRTARADLGDDDTAKQLRARLESALDDASELQKLEESWVDEGERRKWGDWTYETDEYVEHDEATAIAEFIIRTFRPELQGRKIAVVFQLKVPSANRRERMGTAMKLPAKMAFLSDYQAVITLGWEHWIMLTDKDRQRLVHHEYGLRSESERFATDGKAAEVLMSGGSQLTLIEDEAA